MAQLLRTPAFTKINGELPRQLCDHLFAVFSPLALQQFDIDAATDVPIKLGELSVDHRRHTLTCSIDQLAHFGQQVVLSG